jgi:hypothetical protein
MRNQSTFVQEQDLLAEMEKDEEDNLKNLVHRILRAREDCSTAVKVVKAQLLSN